MQNQGQTTTPRITDELQIPDGALLTHLAAIASERFPERFSWPRMQLELWSHGAVELLLRITDEEHESYQDWDTHRPTPLCDRSPARRGHVVRELFGRLGWIPTSEEENIIGLLSSPRFARGGKRPAQPARA